MVAHEKDPTQLTASIQSSLAHSLREEKGTTRANTKAVSLTYDTIDPLWFSVVVVLVVVEEKAELAVY